MPKTKTMYVCTECGYDAPKWVGRCPACGEWNTMKEIRVAAEATASTAEARVRRAVPALAGGGPKPVRLQDVEAREEARYTTGDAELDRVLGGGLVPGSILLLGGEPGIGKSTLLLQTAMRLPSRRVLYVSGEESERQIKLRAERIPVAEGAAAAELMLYCDTSLERILEQAGAVRPEILVVDSIQTMACETVEASAGSVSQIRECAATLLKYAKESGVPVILVGHITKEGTLAGPKVLEHIVDAVLQFEGDRQHLYRILRAIKNRFGSTAELGIYEMRSDGLRPVSNPSEMLLTRGEEELSGVAVASMIEGVRPFLIEVQALVSTAAYGTPQRSATGFDTRRLNMLLAVLEKRVGFKLAQKDVFLNIAGGLRVSDPAIDLAVIAAVLSSNVDTAIARGTAMAGEVGLSGELRPVTRIRQRIAEAQKLGFNRIIIPEACAASAETEGIKGIEIVSVSRVEHALRELFG